MSHDTLPAPAGQAARVPTVAPWGKALSAHSPAPGIHFIVSATAAGYWLEPWRRGEFRARFPAFEPWEESDDGATGAWFESDCDACAIVLCWPEAFGLAEICQAVQVADSMAGTQNAYLRGWGSIAQWLDLSDVGAALRRRVAEWELSIREPAA